MKSIPPNDLGVLVEDCTRVCIDDFLRKYNREAKRSMVRAAVELGNVSVDLTTSKAGFGGERLWFRCPHCDRRIGVLLVHPVDHTLGCRKCLNAEYRARRYRGMVENEVAKGI